MLQPCEGPSLTTRTVSSSFHSLEASAKVEPSPPFPSVRPPTHPALDFPPLLSPMRHANPFSHSPSTPPPLSPCNPFFSLLQQNPFYGDMLTARPLKAAPPPLPYLSSSRPPISHLFPLTDAPDASPIDSGVVHRSAWRDGMDGAEKRPLPPPPAGTFSRRPSNPFGPDPEPDSQWDDSFEAFAAGRLQPPQDPSTACPTQRDASNSLVECCSHGGASITPPEAGWETRSSSSRVANANASAAQSDGFLLFLETIPEQSDSVALDDPDLHLKSPAHAETNQASSSVSVHSSTNTNVDSGSHHPSAAKLHSSSPDPTSSGIGSSVEEDFLSCMSSYSDKFSASSAEESEAQNMEADAIGFEKSCESVRKSKSKPSESDGDGSTDASLLDVDQNRVAQSGSAEDLEDSLLRWCPPGVGQHRPVGAADPQPESKENVGREGFPIPLEDLPPPQMVTSSPSGDLQPAFHIITSSPDAKHNSADSATEGGVWAGPDVPTPFQDVPTGPGSIFDDLLLLPAALSHQGGAGAPQSLYVSSDSQSYRTCRSHPPSRSSSGSELHQTLHSASSTLCGELPGVFPQASEPPLEEPPQTQLGFPQTGESGLAELPAVLTDPCRGHGWGFSKGPPTLQRSHSEGSLTPSSDAPPLPSSAPLTPDLASSPLALCPLPPFANATARSPPKPVSLEIPQQQPQQQAANQQLR